MIYKESKKNDLLNARKQLFQVLSKSFSLRKLIIKRNFFFCEELTILIFFLIICKCNKLSLFAKQIIIYWKFYYNNIYCKICCNFVVERKHQLQYLSLKMQPWFRSHLWVNGYPLKFPVGEEIMCTRKNKLMCLIKNKLSPEFKTNHIKIYII